MLPVTTNRCAQANCVLLSKVWTRHRFIIKKEPHEPSDDKFNQPLGEVPKRKSFKESILPPDWQKMRFKYPEFLPSIEYQSKFRNYLLEKMQRKDMLKRRQVINIPEFYVGCLMAVEIADQTALGKQSRFVGLCIHREGHGLRANFTLRNVIDGFGVEIRYDMYNPAIQDIEVLKFEKRLDDDLRYLRDAKPEYSTVPFDMLPISYDETKDVPLNPLIVQMNPIPWSYHWEKFDWKGMTMEGIPEYIYNVKYRDPKRGFHDQLAFDSMIHYREHITEDDQYDIWRDVSEHEENVGGTRKDSRKKKLFQDRLKKKFVAY